MTTKAKAALEVRSRTHYHARPSESEKGQWTIMRQIAGETRLRPYARTFDVESAHEILGAVEKTGLGTVDPIKPVASGRFAISDGPIEHDRGNPVDIYADGTAIVASSGRRVPKKDHDVWRDQDGDTLADLLDRLREADLVIGGGE